MIRSLTSLKALIVIQRVYNHSENSGYSSGKSISHGHHKLALSCPWSSFWLADFPPICESRQTDLNMASPAKTLLKQLCRRTCLTRHTPITREEPCGSWDMCLEPQPARLLGLLSGIMPHEWGQETLPGVWLSLKVCHPLSLPPCWLQETSYLWMTTCVVAPGGPMATLPASGLLVLF